MRIQGRIVSALIILLQFIHPLKELNDFSDLNDILKSYLHFHRSTEEKIKNEKIKIFCKCVLEFKVETHL